MLECYSVLVNISTQTSALEGKNAYPADSWPITIGSVSTKSAMRPCKQISPFHR